jgi:hypothetical protein
MKWKRQTALTIFGVLLCSSCSTAPKIISLEKQNYTVNAMTQIKVVFPKVTFEKLEDIEEVPAGLTDSQEIAQWVSGLTLQEMRHKGLGADTLPIDERNASGLNKKNLTFFADDLVRMNPSEESLKVFHEACKAEDNVSMAFHYLRVKLGKDRYWVVNGVPLIAWNAVPQVPMSNSTLRAVLRRCPDGDVLWRNEVFLRDIPAVGEASFERAVGHLYQNLSKEE